MGAPKGHAPYPGCETGGRPMKWTEERLDEFAENMLESIQKCKETNKPFWYKDWAFDVDILPPQLTEFAKMNKKFSEAYQKAKYLQEWQVSKGAMYKKFNSNFCQFFLQTQYPETYRLQQNLDVSELTTQQFTSLMQQITDRQSSVLNNSETISSTDSKS